MIYFDITQSGRARHHSGLNRVSTRLREEGGAAFTAVRWPLETTVAPTDWFFTGDLFSEEERPGFSAWIRSRPCRLAAIFHDAIPLRFPHITWPRSVARHPEYLKLLAEFDEVLAVSDASQRDLLEFWRWQGVQPRARVTRIELGADGLRRPRPVARVDPPGPVVLCTGILEPRKNQVLLIEAAEHLWKEGLEFSLHLVGRVNPHFGGPVMARVRAAQQRWPGRLQHHGQAGDAVLTRLYERARVTALPTLAEGCGLPLLESLWHGVPCVCSDLPVLRENADGGGCRWVPSGDPAAWARTLAELLTNDVAWHGLSDAARARTLPTWAAAARRIGALGT